MCQEVARRMEILWHSRRLPKKGVCSSGGCFHCLLLSISKYLTIFGYNPMTRITTAHLCNFMDYLEQYFSRKSNNLFKILFKRLAHYQQNTTWINWQNAGKKVCQSSFEFSGMKRRFNYFQDRIFAVHSVLKNTRLEIPVTLKSFHFFSVLDLKDCT